MLEDIDILLITDLPKVYQPVVKILWRQKGILSKIFEEQKAASKPGPFKSPAVLKQLCFIGITYYLSDTVLLNCNFTRCPGPA